MHQHCCGESSVDQMSRGTFRFINLAVGRIVAPDVGTVVATIRIARNSVPMKRRGVSEASNRHCRSRHNLISARHNWCLQHPQQLIRVSIRVTAGAGIRSGCRCRGAIEPGSPQFYLPFRWVFQAYNASHFRFGYVGKINHRNSVRDRIVNPRSRKRGFLRVVESNAARYGADIDTAQDVAAGGVNGKEFV